MNYVAIAFLSLVTCFWSINEVRAEGFFDNLNTMLDRVTDKFEKKTEQRLNKSADNAVESFFDATDEQIDCSFGDKECNAKESNSMKCLATDVACLKKAHSIGKQVEIVDEEDLDLMRCEVTDVSCLSKAKSLGIRVEIVE